MAPSARKISILAVTGILVTTCLFAQVPPEDLHLEGDHWTAWNPPSEAPEGAEIYFVQPGDTLWDLAAQHFGDPYLWPQLWERNQYVLDSHWIYPGDPMIMSIDVVPLDALAQAQTPVEPTDASMADSSMASGGAGGVTGTGGADGTGGAGAAGGAEQEDMRFAPAASAPVPLGTESDIYCSGFIADENRSFPFAIVGSEVAALAPSIYGAKQRKTIEGKFGVITTLKSGLTTSDIIYVDGGRSAGMSAGAAFTIVSPQRVVRHPVSGAQLGRFYRHLGQARILSVQEETAMAEIMHSCHPAEIGALLMPFVPEPVPLARRTRMRPVNLPASDAALKNAGTVVYVDHDFVSLGQGHVVFIDRGADDDVTPGDMYTIYRLNNPGLPAVVLGELAVLSVQGNTAMTKVLSSRYTIRVGDRVAPK
jgi:hypothetical protein